MAKHHMEKVHFVIESGWQGLRSQNLVAMTKSPLPFYGLCCSNKSNTFGYSDGFQLVPFFLSGCGSGNFGEINHNLQTWVLVVRPIKTTFVLKGPTHGLQMKLPQKVQINERTWGHPEKGCIKCFHAVGFFVFPGWKKQMDDAPLLQTECCKLMGCVPRRGIRSMAAGLQR
jgi:hypothetical protein